MQKQWFGLLFSKQNYSCKQLMSEYCGCGNHVSNKYVCLMIWINECVIVIKKSTYLRAPLLHFCQGE